MYAHLGSLARAAALACLAAFLITASVFAQTARVVIGTVRNPLGAPVSGATVTLTRNGGRIADTRTDTEGRFTLSGVAEGRYEIAARAAGFAPLAAQPLFVSGASAPPLMLTMQIGVQQEVVVTASAEETPMSQTGASVSVIGADTLQALAKPDVVEALRLVPGVSVVQTGARGARATAFVRGGAANFNKVLIDGVPANEIGGDFDFSSIALTGIDRVEVLRNANSVQYGVDALSGVISLTTRRGRTHVPEVGVSLDGGTLNTGQGDVSIGGTAGRVDYFAELSRFATDNDLPNNAFRNATFASRLGATLGSAVDVSVTMRAYGSEYGTPNAFDNYGIADDSTSKRDARHLGVSFDARLSPRWRTSAQLGVMDQNTHFDNPGPTGERSDPSDFANYLGQTVTIRGANGYSATGRAILDFGGTYPSTTDTSSTRVAASGHATGHIAPWLDVTAGARVEQEDARLMTTFSTEPSKTSRTSGGVFGEGRANLRRLFVTAGIAYDHNAVFESAVTPRVSAAFYLRNPSATSMLGDTKLTANAGKGVKAPDLTQELQSLYSLVRSLPAASQTLLAGLSPIGPERNVGWDVGVEQGFWGGRARARAAYFDNQFEGLIEFVSSHVLPRLGVPEAAAAATGFGAYFNASSQHSRGVELSGEVQAGPFVRLSGSYTHLSAVVDESFASSALGPSFNPAFPTIPIGAFSPLEGAAPFRRPANSGNLLASFARGPVQVALAGYFSGRSDDSTFLADEFFGNTMLLPNHDLNAGYQKVDLSGSYQLHPRLRWYASVENLFDRDYHAAFGFPALPLTVRSGISVALGGDRRP